MATNVNIHSSGKQCFFMTSLVLSKTARSTVNPMCTQTALSLRVPYSFNLFGPLYCNISANNVSFLCTQAILKPKSTAWTTWRSGIYIVYLYLFFIFIFHLFDNNKVHALMLIHDNFEVFSRKFESLLFLIK